MIEGITLFGIIIGLFPLSILLIRRLQLIHTPEIKAIKPFLWLLFIGSVYEIVFALIFRVRTTPWIHTYYLLEFLMLYYFFRKLFQNKYMYALNSFLIVYVVVWLVLSLLGYEIMNKKDDSYLGTLETIFVYTFVILWFREIFRNAEVESLWKLPVFYFMVGFVFYFVGAFFVNLLSQDIFRITGLMNKYWIISVVLNLVMRVLLCIGVWKATEVKLFSALKKLT